MPLNNDWPQPLISADTRVIVNSLPVPRRFSTGPPRYHHHSRLNKICSREKCSNAGDRKSTRLNSSHLGISYAVFCLKKKKSRKPPALSTNRKAAKPRYRRTLRSEPLFFFFNDTATTEIYTLSLHDALPISPALAPPPEPAPAPSTPLVSGP